MKKRYKENETYPITEIYPRHCPIPQHRVFQKATHLMDKALSACKPSKWCKPSHTSQRDHATTITSPTNLANTHLVNKLEVGGETVSKFRMQGTDRPKKKVARWGNMNVSRIHTIQRLELEWRLEKRSDFLILSWSLGLDIGRIGIGFRRIFAPCRPRNGIADPKTWRGVNVVSNGSVSMYHNSVAARRDLNGCSTSLFGMRV